MSQVNTRAARGPGATRGRCRLIVHLFVAVALAASSLFLHGQGSHASQAATAESQDAAHRELPQFEVATIKPDQARLMQTDVYPGRVVIDDQSLKGLIAIAFNLSYWQISGGEHWTADDAYDVEAKCPESDLSSIATLRHSLFEIDDEHLREMLQALLIDRFQLKYHVETKMGSVYLLKRSGKTLRLLRAKAASSDAEQASAESPADSWGSIGWAEGWVLWHVTMPQLAHFAGSVYLHRPVLDRTGLAGAYDYRSPHEDPDSEGVEAPDSFVNMIHDVGLKLEPGKGPVDIFVIDHAERPLPN